MPELADTKWPDLGDRPGVLVPVGSLEQHGPHLPLNTDTVIAEAVTRRAAELLGQRDLLVAPAIAYGASGEHQAFAGTSSIGTEALGHTVVELVRSMSTWSGRVVLVNAHGGNVTALAGAIGQLIVEGHDTAWVACSTRGIDAHAGYAETSLMLHLAPWTVRIDRAEPGNTTPLAELLPTLGRDGVDAVAANGVLGDPRAATAREGRRLLEAMAREVAALINAGRPDSHGMLGVSKKPVR